MENIENNSKYLTITGILFPDNRFLLQPCYLTEHPQHVTQDAESPFMVELVDDLNRILLRHRIPLSSYCAIGIRMEEKAVLGKIPFPSGTHIMRFHHHEVLIHELEVPRNKPTVQIMWKPKGVVEGRHIIRWKGGHHDDKDLHYIVSYSHTDGESWQPLSFSTKESQHEIDFDLLPGGDSCRVSILATDGVNTILAESLSFSIPVKKCHTMIFAPENESNYLIGEPILFQGQGYYLEEQQAEIEALVWISSKDGEIGRGPAIQKRDLSPGVHQITLMAGAGNRLGEAQISIGIGGESHQEWVLS